MLSAVPALVLGCSLASLAVIRSLSRRGIPVACLCYGFKQPAASSRHVHRKFECPNPNDDEGGFIEYLLSLDAEWDGGVVIPTDDASLVAASRYKVQLAKRYRVMAADWDMTRVFIEKRHTYEFADRHGLPCPKMRVARDEQEILTQACEVGFPCLLKPSVSHTFFNKFCAKMLMVHNIEELRQAIEKLGDYDSELMICEFIPGDDTCGVNYNSYCHGGEPLYEFTAQKLRLYPATIGFPTAVVSRRLPEVIAAGRQVMAAFGYSGFSCTEFKRDIRDGIFKLMEVNARHNHSGWLAVTSGMDFPYISYLFAIGADPEIAGQALPTEGIYWIDEGRDVQRLLATLRSGTGTLRSYLEPYRGRHVFAVSSASDPLPGAKQLAEALCRVAVRRVTALRQGRLFLSPN